MKKVQILRALPEARRWEFVAHGAAYDRSEAEEMKKRIEARGQKVRLIPLP